MLSPVLQALIDKGLFERIPATFSTFVFEQIREWETLFPAERGYFERLCTLIDLLPEGEFAELFGGLRVVEAKMGVNAKTWPRRTFTLEQVDFLNRNAHYAEWRQVIAGIFSRVDPVLEAEVRRRGRPRLNVVVSPGELPVGPERLWLKLRGRRVALKDAFDPAEHLPPLLKAGPETPYERWLIEADAELQPGPGMVRLSYAGLEAYRQRLTEQVQQVVEKEQIRGPRELGARLKKMRLMPGEGPLGADPVLAEFARAVLLAGNGTLLINNTFVEWAAVQAVRRARPTLLVAKFGIRNKMKPFSSLLIHADPEKANPIPTQVDTLGTYVDLELLYLYIWQEFEKYAEYERNTVHLFCAAGMDEALVIAPGDFGLRESMSAGELIGAAKDWLQW
jgi:hypothetical protein